MVAPHFWPFPPEIPKEEIMGVPKSDPEIGPESVKA